MVTYAKISPRIVEPGDIAGGQEAEEDDIGPVLTQCTPLVLQQTAVLA